MGSSASSRPAPHSHHASAPVLYDMPYSIPNEYYPVHLPSTSNGQTAGGTAPIRSIVPGPLYTSTSWDEKRDLTYSRILSAEEFLSRMLEQDESLRVVSQMPDRDQYSVHITEILGVRGHLNNELLRIQQMLAANDPRMKCISEFEESHSAVVQKLRELRDESERLQQRSSGIDASTEIDFRNAIFGLTGITMSTNTEDGNNDGFIALRSKGEMGTNTGDGRGNMLDESLETEDDLHIKHSQEESLMANRYAQVIAGGRQMSIDELNSLLSIHGQNVHALKMKQEHERKLFRDRLNQKRKELDGESSSDGGSSADLNASMDSRSSMARARRREREARREKEKNNLESPTHVNNKNSDGQEVDIDGMLRNHSAVLRGFRSKQEMDRKKFEQILQKKKQQKDGLNSNGNHFNGDDEDSELNNRSSSRAKGANGEVENDRNLQSIVQTLEALRLRGELNDTVVARLMSKYYGGGHNGDTSQQGQGGRRNSKQTSHKSDQESASQLVQQTQAKQKELQTKRQQEKEIVEAKLREKLQSRNYNQRMSVPHINID